MSSGGRKCPAGEIQVCERQQREHLGPVLGDAAIAHLSIAELALLYGPAARCKPKISGDDRSCVFVLHQLPDFAAAADPSYDPEKRSIELRSEAERSLGMARVLAAGGLPEEALPLTARAIGIAAAARLAALGELPAGVSTAAPALVRQAAHPAQLPPP